MGWVSLIILLRKNWHWEGVWSYLRLRHPSAITAVESSSPPFSSVEDNKGVDPRLINVNEYPSMPYGGSGIGATKISSYTVIDIYSHMGYIMRGPL